MSTITGTNGPDVLNGDLFPFHFPPLFDNADTINGLDGDDIIDGRTQNDTLNGGGGNDTLTGGAGVDTLNGGDGNDTITSDGDGGTYRGDAGNDTMRSGLGTEFMDGGAGIDLIDHTAWNGDYVFNMTTGLTNFAGETYLNFENARLGNGNDTVTGNAANNTIDGGGGNDCLFGNAGNDSLLGGLGNDTLNGGVGADLLNGGAGIDTASYLGAAAGATVNLATGATGGSAAGDVLIGIENLVGSTFNDTLIGNVGNNQLCGAAGNDILLGDAGNDLLNGGLGNDVLNGGAGIDTVDYSNKIVCGVSVPGATSGVVVNLNILVAQNTVGSGLDTFSGIENITGTNFNDTLIGNGTANVLNGGLGNDLLIGGAGLDTLNGGVGNDTFDYNAASESPVGAGRDVIVGFAGNGALAGDLIDLSTIDANASLVGNQAFTAAQLSYVGGILSANIIGTAAAPDLQIDLLGASLNLAADIIL